MTKRIDEVISEITLCKVILSSSLHGLILANGYGVPNNWIASDAKLQGDDKKFLDYLESCGVRPPVQPISLATLPDFKSLKAAAETGIITNHSELLEPLWDACPFIPKPTRMPSRPK